MLCGYYIHTTNICMEREKERGTGIYENSIWLVYAKIRDEYLISLVRYAEHLSNLRWTIYFWNPKFNGIRISKYSIQVLNHSLDLIRSEFMHSIQPIRPVAWGSIILYRWSCKRQVSAGDMTPQRESEWRAPWHGLVAGLFNVAEILGA